MTFGIVFVAGRLTEGVSNSDDSSFAVVGRRFPNVFLPIFIEPQRSRAATLVVVAVLNDAAATLAVASGLDLDQIVAVIIVEGHIIQGVGFGDQSIAHVVAVTGDVTQRVGEGRSVSAVVVSVKGLVFRVVRIELTDQVAARIVGVVHAVAAAVDAPEHLVQGIVGPGIRSSDRGASGFDPLD